MNTTTKQLIERKEEINFNYRDVYSLAYDYDDAELIKELNQNGYSISEAREVAQAIYESEYNIAYGIYVPQLLEAFPDMATLGEVARMKLEEDPDNIHYILQYTTEEAILLENGSFIRMTHDNFNEILHKFNRDLNYWKREVEEWINEEKTSIHFRFHYLVNYFYSESREEEYSTWETIEYHEKLEEVAHYEALLPQKPAKKQKFKM